ncbi:MAG: PilZ domain-containing protein [Vulcanimicrobiota bacterium]
MLLDFLAGPVVDYLDGEQRLLVLRSDRFYARGKILMVRINLPDASRTRPMQVVVESCRNLTGGGFALVAVLLGNEPLPAWGQTGHDDTALRAYQRVECQLCVVSKDLPGYRTNTLDFSQGGLQLVLPEAVAHGASVLLRLEFDVDSLPPIECCAQVVWCKEWLRNLFKVGLQFVRVSPENRLALRRYEKIARQRQNAPIDHQLHFEDAYAPDVPLEVEPSHEYFTGSGHEGRLRGYERNSKGLTVRLSEPSGNLVEYRFEGVRGLVDRAGEASTRSLVGDMLTRPTIRGCKRYIFVDPFGKELMEVVASSCKREVRDEED